MEISGKIHAPAAVPPLPIQQEAGWIPGPVWKALEKRNSLPSLEVETQTKRPHITKRRRDIRCPMSGMPASYSIGPTLKPRLETGYSEREFNDFLQSLHTNTGIIPLTLILLTWRIWWAPNNASKWQMGFNSAFKGFNSPTTGSFHYLSNSGTVRHYTMCDTQTSLHK